MTSNNDKWKGVFSGKSIGYIRNPFNSFKKKTQLGVVKTNCMGCSGCRYETYGEISYPCSQCSHNLRNKDNPAAQDFYIK